MTLDEIIKEWNKTAKATHDELEFHENLAVRQNLIFKLLVHIAGELKQMKGESK